MIIETPIDYVHFGVHWEASDWYNEDYIGFMLLQRMLGDFERKGFHDSVDDFGHDFSNKLT